MFARIAGILRAAAVTGVVAFCLWAGASFSMPDRIPEDFMAMNPTLKPGQYYLLDRRGGWKSGQIVRFVAPPGVAAPRGGKTFLAARVVAAEGQTVSLAGGELTVDGERVRWDGFAPVASESFPALRVPRGHLLLLADNGAVALEGGKPLDGRSFGMVPVDAVDGAILFF